MSTPEHDSDAAPRAISMRRRFLALPTLISFAFAIAFIAFLFTRFDLDLGETWTDVRGANPGYLVLAFFAYYLSFPVRGWRWRLLLRNAGVFKEASQAPPTVMAHSELILISWFANSVSWLRMGDALRGYLLSNRLSVSFSRIMGTILAERVVDVALVFALLILAGFGLLRSDVNDTVGIVIVAATALTGVGVATLFVMRLFGLRLARRLPDRIQLAYERFQAGTLGSFQRLPALAALTIVIWLLETARLFFVIEAMGFEVGLALILFAALAHSLLTTVPITPGGLGVVELGLTGLLALSPVLGSNEAAAVTLVDRSITYLSILVFGGLAFAVYQARQARRGVGAREGMTEPTVDQGTRRQ